MPIRALIFDFDGLILDTEWSEFVTVRAEFEAHGAALELDDWRHRVGRADNPHWTTWLEEVADGPVDVDAVRTRRLEAHHAMIRAEEVRPGVVALLDEADAAGVPAAVASSSPASWVEPHLERVGLLGRFTAVRCRDHVSRGKPAPDLFLAAAEALGAAPARSVALEDSHHGSTAARAAGFVCVVAPNAVTRVPEFPDADLVVDSLADVDLASLGELVDRVARRRPDGDSSGGPGGAIGDSSGVGGRP
jgi:HAD superfamily hydrolase (TIGR01509 family)